MKPNIFKVKKKSFMLLMLLCCGLTVVAQKTIIVTKTIKPLLDSVPVVWQHNVKGGIHQVPDTSDFNKNLLDTAMIAMLYKNHNVYQWNGSKWRQIQLIRQWETGAVFYTGDLFIYNNVMFAALKNDTIAAYDNPYTDRTTWSNTASGSIIVGNAVTATDSSGITVLNDTLHLEYADSIHPGIVSIDSQIFAGNKFFADSVAIGTTSPQARLQVNGSLLATGTFNSSDSITISGAGTRMMWFPAKAAFRAGYVDGTHWDNDSIGSYSFAAGRSTTASGKYSIAMGLNTTASGYYSTAIGRATTASRIYSTATGHNTTASGRASTAMGYYTTASAFASTAIGRYNVGGGTSDIWIATDPLFEIGNGTSATKTSNAVTVLKNGNVGIGTATPDALLHITGNIKMVDGNQGERQILISDSTGVASWNSIGSLIDTTSLSLDNAYNNGRTITADSGAFEVNGTSGALFTGTFGSSDIIPASRVGTRMMWFPAKAAFRAGYVDGNQWDNNSIGSYSFAAGRSTTASGKYSTAMGYETTASGDYSTAMGEQTTVSGNFSTAMGYSTTASGDYSIAVGFSTTASGIFSTAGGCLTTASGSHSTAMGEHTEASGHRSTVMGSYTEASGKYSTAMGYYTEASAYASTAIGRYNVGGGTADSWVATDPLFEIGNGTSATDTSNAVTVLKNGNVGIGTATPDTSLHIIGNIKMVDGNQGEGQILISDSTGVASWNSIGSFIDTTISLDDAYNNGRTITADSGAFEVNGTSGALFTGTYGSSDSITISGAGTRMMWFPAKAAFRAGYVDGTQWDNDSIGNYSTAMGLNTTASGDVSTAMGWYTAASGKYSTAMGAFTSTSGFISTAMGHYTTASGFISTAMGSYTTASGDYSTAMGYNTTASGDYSTAMGYNTTASAYASTAIGQYNVGGGTADSWVATDPLFEIGNGTSSTNTSNAVTVLKNGNVEIFQDLTVDGSIYGTVSSSSDKRLKKNIKTLTGVLDKINQMRGVSFEFKKQQKYASGAQIGVIAQELQKVFPELVIKKNDGYLTVNYSQLSAVVLQAVNEQQQEIDLLKKQMKQVMNKLGIE